MKRETYCNNNLSLFIGLAFAIAAGASYFTKPSAPSQAQTGATPAPALYVAPESSGHYAPASGGHVAPLSRGHYAPKASEPA